MKTQTKMYKRTDGIGSPIYLITTSKIEKDKLRKDWEIIDEEIFYSLKEATLYKNLLKL